MTTVACVFVRGHVPFGVEYVKRLASMVRRWMDRPYRFVCLTDRPALMPRGVEAITVQPFQGCFAWWTKLRLFDPSLGLTGRVLYLDLDTLVVNALSPLLEYPARFALVPHAGKFDGKRGRQVVKRFNSSVMTWHAGEQAHLFHGFDHALTERLWGDQDAIGEACPEAATFPDAWCPRFSALEGARLTPEAKVILMKTPKNVEAARRYRWVREAWV
jgi:hypothetical protein